MKVTVEINVASFETFEDALKRHVSQLLNGPQKISGENFVTPPQKNLDDLTTCPTSQTVAEIHTIGSTELNAEPAQDFKVDVKPRKTRAKKSEIVTKEEVVALAKAAIDPQDIEDEKAEVNTSVLTHDDLRAVIGEFTKIHGIAKAQKMVPVILGCAIVDVPADQDSLQLAIDKIKAEINSDDDTDMDDEPTAAESDVREALMAYAKKYDGDDAKLTNTLVDGPKILVGELGEGITAIRLIPKDPHSYGRALQAINKAITENPFNREIAL